MTTKKINHLQVFIVIASCVTLGACGGGGGGSDPVLPIAKFASPEDNVDGGDGADEDEEVTVKPSESGWVSIMSGMFSQFGPR